MAPKAPEKEVHCDDMPPGWRCLEKIYLTGSCAGKTYLRFKNDLHSNVLSVKAAWKLEAEDRGLDVEKVTREYEAKQAKRKEAEKLEREKEGKLVGQKREDGIERFRAEYGPLNGATICCFPGWKSESKLLEKCGQISAAYYDPEGRIFKLVKDIEAFFGNRMEEGKPIPDIEAARASVTTDENGKVINTARQAESIVQEFTVKREVKKGKRKHRAAIVQEEDYHDTRSLKLFCWTDAKRMLPALEKHGATDAGKVVESASECQKYLEQRGFKDVQLICVAGSKDASAAERKVLDTIAGVFFKKPGKFNGRVFFQQVGQVVGKQMVCSPVHLFWSVARDGWKIGVMEDRAAGLALNCQDKASPSELSAKWSLLLAADLDADADELIARANE